MMSLTVAVPLPVLADTSALLGCFLEGDARHEPAVRVLAQLRASRRPIHTTSDVFDETVSSVRKRADYEGSLLVGEFLRAWGLLRLHPVDREIREAGWRIFRRHRWPGLSLTDCTSAALMERLGIEEVFTFDEDFRKLGFRTLPPPGPLLRPAPRGGPSRRRTLRRSAPARPRFDPQGPPR